MATDSTTELHQLISGLQNGGWGEILERVEKAVIWIRGADPGDPRIDEVASALANLASHDKWEIRRAVAHAAANLAQPAFEPILARLAGDANARVRQAAQQSALRRKDGRHASILGKQHEDRINAALDGIQARYGLIGREAVKRAAEDIANTFARELYHEVIKLMSPLATAADRLKTQLESPNVSRESLIAEAGRIGRQVRRLEAILNGMRSYTAAPSLHFAPESIREILDEAAQLVRGEGAVAGPGIDIDAPPDCTCEVARSRLVQAFANLLSNAMESYEGINRESKAIEVRMEAVPGSLKLTIQDFGAGMSPEVLRDAPTLFATGKPKGTGFGLPLAIKIVESEHGGRLRIESKVDIGTTVHVVLPVRHIDAR